MGSEVGKVLSRQAVILSLARRRWCRRWPQTHRADPISGVYDMFKSSKHASKHSIRLRNKNLSTSAAATYRLLTRACVCLCVWCYIPVSVLSSIKKRLLRPGWPVLVGPSLSSQWFSISNYSLRWCVLLFFVFSLFFFSRWSLRRKVKYAFDISRCFESWEWRYRWAGQGSGLLWCRQDDNFWMNGPIRLYDYVLVVQKLRKYVPIFIGREDCLSELTIPQQLFLVCF